MKTSSFMNVSNIVNGVSLSGFAAGDDVAKIEFDSGATNTVGADGTMVVHITANRTAKVTISVLAESSANAYLTKLWNAQRGGPRTFIPINYSMKDSYRQDKISGWFGFISKPGVVGRGEKFGKMDWEFTVEKGVLDLGDPTFAGLATAAAEAAGATA